jgi:hypothetical protein
MPRQDPKLAHAYLRSLQQTVKSEDLLVVAREGFEIRSKILGYEVLIESAGLIADGSFVSAVLDSMPYFRSHRRDSYGVITYLGCFDVNPTAVAEGRDACGSA